MRIRVLGNCDSARALRGDLDHAGFVVGAQGRFTIHLQEGKPGEILVDSIEGMIDRAIVAHLRQLATLPLRFQTVGGIQSEFEIRIHVPPDEGEQILIEKAILRGLLSIGNPQEPEAEALPQPQPKTKPWRDWLSKRSVYDRTVEG